MIEIFINGLLFVVCTYYYFVVNDTHALRNLQYVRFVTEMFSLAHPLFQISIATAEFYFILSSFFLALFSLVALQISMSTSNWRQKKPTKNQSILSQTVHICITVRKTGPNHRTQKKAVRSNIASSRHVFHARLRSTSGRHIDSSQPE